MKTLTMLLLLTVLTSLPSASTNNQCTETPNVESIKKDIIIANNLLHDLGWHDSVYLHVSYRYNKTVFTPQTDKILTESTIDQLPSVYNEIYSNREDINVILHVENPDITSISFDADGILPIDQQYYAVYPVSYNMNELLTNKESYILLLQNGDGVLVLGEIMHDTYYRLWYLRSAAQSQIATLSVMNKNDVIIPSKQVQLNTLNGRMNPPQFEGYKPGHPEYEAFKRKHGYNNINITKQVIDNPNIPKNPKFAQIRTELAMLYNLIGKLGLDEMIYNHITARLPVNISEIDGNDDNYTDYLLINPFGLDFSEIKPNHLIAFLIKVEIDENNPDRPTKYKVLNPGNSIPPFNGRVFNSGLELHAAIHSVRSDVNYALHIHHPALTAIGSYKYGLLPLNKLYYDIIKPIAYHSYGNFAKRQNKMQLINDIGYESNVVILRNHGIITMGKTIDDAFNRLYYALQLAKLQVNVMKMGLLNQDGLEEILEYMRNDNVNDQQIIISKDSHLNWWQRFKLSQFQNI